jgi:response regulator RpfG family c-di-GMP phosphodiesterase
MNKKNKILIVEDEVSERRALSEKLTRKNYKIFGAENGLVGLEIALKRHPDLILLDILMPKMDGVGFINKLRLDKWGKSVPVMVLTNKEAERKMLKFLKKDRDCLYYMIKSDWKLSDIVKRIDRVLK